MAQLKKRYYPLKGILNIDNHTDNIEYYQYLDSLNGNI